MKIFLSYASEDRELADQIQLALTGDGYEVFFDRKDLPPAGDYHTRIKAAVEGSDILVFLISPDSLSSGSYPLTELKYARVKWSHPKGQVLPVLVREVAWESIPAYLRAVTVLEPEGNIPAEVLTAVSALTEEVKAQSQKDVPQSLIQLKMGKYLLVGLPVLGISILIVLFAKGRLTGQPDTRQSETLIAPAPTPVIVEKEPQAGPPLQESVKSVDAPARQRIRVEKALQAIASNSQVDSQLASLSTAFENLFKGRAQTVDIERDKPLIAEIYDLHKTFDRDAWSWFPRLVQEVEVLDLLDRAEIAYAKDLAGCYDRTLVVGVQPLEPFWFLLEQSPTKSPPQQLSELIRDTREKLRSGSQDRAAIITALTKLLQRSGSGPIPEFRCRFNPSPNPRPEADAGGAA